MAGKTLSRRTLRDERDRAEVAGADLAAGAVEPGGPPAPGKKPRARKVAAPKAPAAPRVRKKAVKLPPRMYARWAVCDGGLKRVALFDYRDRAGADARLAELSERKVGAYVLQLVKDPYDPPPAAV